MALSGGLLLGLILFFSNATADQSNEMNPQSPPPMKKWPEDLKYPDCPRLLDPDDRMYAKEAGQVRLKVSDERMNFSTSCDDIRARGFYPERPMSEEEAEFPVAFANIVYKDYILLERMFSVMYTPQNFYCYSIDKKAPAEFKERIRNLSKCFPNVIVPEEEFSVASSGLNVSNAHLSCMRALQPFKWKYLMLLQNHDFPLRTNRELVQVLKIFNGANDISTLKPSGHSVDWNANRTLANLHLYRNESKNTERFQGKLQRLKPTKSLVGVSLSRAFIDFILNELDVSGFVQQLEKVYGQYGMDENFLSTLNSNDLLSAPGGFTRACLDRGVQVQCISRDAVWGPERQFCSSRHFRHNVCIYGVEDIFRISQLKELFGNKFMPIFDYGSAHCWLETLYNRTYFNNTSGRVDPQPYETLPHVRYNKLKTGLKKGERVNGYTFDCTYVKPATSATTRRMMRD